MRLLLALAILLLSPALAFAHPGADHANGLVHGMAHPLGGVDHILAMVAVGVFAYVLGGRALILVPLSFVAMMVAGFALGSTDFGLPLVELAIAGSSVAIGVAAAWGRPVPLVGAMALVGSFAVFHGHAHGMEMPVDSGGLTYALGFVIATALLHLSGMLGTKVLARVIGHHGRLAAQLAGGLCALGGVGVLAGWL